MTLKSTLITLFFGYFSFAQTQINLIDMDSNNKIPDVLIISKNKIIGYSNNNGEFIIKTEANISKTITFNHLDYDSKTVDYTDLKENNVIKLKLKPTELEEIFLTASKALSKEEIIKKAVKAFKNNIRKDPYWSQANLKQFTKLNDSLPAYIEVDGDMLLLGKNNNVWKHPILVPKQIRRTKENYLSKPNPKKYNHYGMYLFSDNFISIFRFFEVRHPLSKKGNKLYNFNLEGKTEIDNKEYYVISYYSKKTNISISSTNFHSINGQIIIEKDNFNIVKATSLFRRSQEKKPKLGLDVIYDIDYTNIEDLIYYHTISYDLLYFNTAKNIKLSMTTRGKLSFSNIDVESRSNYNNSLFSNRNLFINSELQNSYDKNYWINTPLMCCGFESELEPIFNSTDNNIIFTEGANQTVNTSSKEIITRIQEKEVLDLLKERKLKD
ncbi:hypothetical protein [Lacinutrix algicola]|uniref:hypothetical protein n=1 Tax=Lacinutrix algicola TaxID=342954 RepID=UPI0006E3F64A|nr:hypothetical protein [Lacinutrix algicola]